MFFFSKTDKNFEPLICLQLQMQYHGIPYNEFITDCDGRDVVCFVACRLVTSTFMFGTMFKNILIEIISSSATRNNTHADFTNVGKMKLLVASLLWKKHVATRNVKHVVVLQFDQKIYETCFVLLRSEQSACSMSSPTTTNVNPSTTVCCCFDLKHVNVLHCSIRNCVSAFVCMICFTFVICFICVYLPCPNNNGCIVAVDGGLFLAILHTSKPEHISRQAP